MGKVCEWQSSYSDELNEIRVLHWEMQRNLRNFVDSYSADMCTMQKKLNNLERKNAKSKIPDIRDVVVPAVRPALLPTPKQGRQPQQGRRSLVS